MIISATYTANMAAFLTLSRSQSSINSIVDLGSQGKVEYGEKVMGNVGREHHLFSQTI